MGGGAHSVSPDDDANEAAQFARRFVRTQDPDLDPPQIRVRRGDDFHAPGKRDAGLLLGAFSRADSRPRAAGRVFAHQVFGDEIREHAQLDFRRRRAGQCGGTARRGKRDGDDRERDQYFNQGEAASPGLGARLRPCDRSRAAAICVQEHHLEE